MIKDSQGNILVPVCPQNKRDTFMASVCILMFGSECQSKRNTLRQQLLQLFKKHLEEENCYKHHCIKTFVKRLHAIDHSEFTTVSAEQMYNTNKDTLLEQGYAFIQKSEEGHIFDRFTFGYLVGEHFNVNVYIHQPESVSLPRDWIQMNVHYDIHIRYDPSSHRFEPLMHRILRVPYMTPHHVLERTRHKLYDLMCVNKDVEQKMTSLFTPQVVGYRVHTARFKTNGASLYKINGKLMGETYVYLMCEDNDFQCVAYANPKSKELPCFYTSHKNMEYTVCVVVAPTEEEADQCIKMEKFTF